MSSEDGCTVIWGIGATLVNGELGTDATGGTVEVLDGFAMLELASAASNMIGVKYRGICSGNSGESSERMEFKHEQR